ncbi:MAG: hypothetical protein V1736_05875 [Pseudomonadota bacterium]
MPTEHDQAEETISLTEQTPFMKNYTEDHLLGMQELQDRWEEEFGLARGRLLSLLSGKKNLTKT